MTITKTLPPITEDEDRKPERRSRIVRGINAFPCEVPEESVLLGNGWIRRGDVATFISTAGAGKSVAVTQAAIAWGLGLPYLGVSPKKPLRVLLFSGEDDEVTIGQCREGFLENSLDLVGKQLTTAELAPLDQNLRIEFIREHVGQLFHSHLRALLTEEPADLVIINPMLSYLGGEVVACASEWLRAGLMTVLLDHDCAGLVAHHTPKLAKDGWENTDDTYAAIGGAELGNVPRTILTLRPTQIEGLCVLKVAKRKTTGWKDQYDNFTSSYFVQQSRDPERPAWLPVPHDEAHEMITDGKPTSKKGAKKATTDHVMPHVQAGAINRQSLIERVMKVAGCSEKPAKDAITLALDEGLIVSFDGEKSPRGGKPMKWFCLTEHKSQWVK